MGLLRRFPAVVDRCGIFQVVRWHRMLVEGGIGKVCNGLGGCTECGRRGNPPHHGREWDGDKLWLSFVLRHKDTELEGVGRVQEHPVEPI